MARSEKEIDVNMQQLACQAFYGFDGSIQRPARGRLQRNPPYDSEQLVRWLCLAGEVITWL